MLTVYNEGNNHHQWRGLSTDTKPTKWSANNLDGAYNGDVFVEINTGKVFIFDETGNQWREF